MKTLEKIKEEITALGYSHVIQGEFIFESNNLIKNLKSHNFSDEFIKLKTEEYSKFPFWVISHPSLCGYISGYDSIEDSYSGIQNKYLTL